MSESPDGAVYVLAGPDRVAWIKLRQAAVKWREDGDLVNNLDRDFKRVATAAGVEDVSAHDLRRSCLTHGARKFAVYVTKEPASYSSIQTTL